MAESKSLSENKHVSVLSGKIKRTANQVSLKLSIYNIEYLLVSLC